MVRVTYFDKVRYGSMISVIYFEHETTLVFGDNGHLARSMVFGHEATQARQ